MSNPPDSEYHIAQQQKLGSADIARRVFAAILMVGLIGIYVAMGAALYPIMDERLGSWFTFLCWAAFMLAALNAYIPAYSFIASLWLKGSVQLRQKEVDEAARQRNKLALMTARSRQMYGEAGPPESMSGDVSENQVKNRDVGAGRRR